MISGFLIPSTLQRADSTLTRFAIHRAFRLYPAYWVSLAVATLLPWLCIGKLGIAPGLLLVNVTMLQRFVGVADAVGAYWTLQIELIFYFLCAMLFALGWLRARLLIIYCCLSGAVVTAVARYISGKELPVALFIAMSLMFLGDTLRAYLKRSANRCETIHAMAVVWFSLIPICILGYRESAFRYVLTYWLAIFTFCCAMKSSRWLAARRCRAGVLLFLGNISYSVYLLHSPIGLWLAGHLFRRTGNLLLSGIAGLAATILGAWIVFKCVELPLILLGRKISDKYVSAGGISKSVEDVSPKGEFVR